METNLDTSTAAVAPDPVAERPGRVRYRTVFETSTGSPVQCTPYTVHSVYTVQYHFVTLSRQCTVCTEYCTQCALYSAQNCTGEADAECTVYTVLRTLYTSRCIRTGLRGTVPSPVRTCTVQYMSGLAPVRTPASGCTVYTVQCTVCTGQVLCTWLRDVIRKDLRSGLVWTGPQSDPESGARPGPNGVKMRSGINECHSLCFLTFLYRKSERELA